MAIPNASIYSERPYAAALEDQFSNVLCANCFMSGKSSEMLPCPRQCKYCVYCDEKCSEEDWISHEFECVAYRALMIVAKSDETRKSIPVRARIVGRILTRLRHDNGVVMLCDDRFPKYVTDRKFGDLISHFEEINGRKWSKNRMKNLAAAFYEFFASTPLKATPLRKFYVTFCTFRINSFCITNRTDALGLGLYLNTSRFNHSCAPSASVRFRGARLVISARAHLHADEYNDEHRFNQITIDYGTSPNYERGQFFSLIRQRVDSLKARYFFRCLCPLCVDSTVGLIEERSANVECANCRKPYVWTIKGRLQPLCGCGDSKSAAVARGTTAKDQGIVRMLDKQWKAAMDNTEYAGPRTTLRLCEPVWAVAKQYWHSTANIRLAQLVERLAMAYSTIKADAIPYPEECMRRKECYLSVAKFYDRTEWGRSMGRQYVSMADVWDGYSRAGGGVPPSQEERAKSPPDEKKTSQESL